MQGDPNETTKSTRDMLTSRYSAAYSCFEALLIHRMMNNQGKKVAKKNDTLTTPANRADAAVDKFGSILQ